MSVMVRTDVLLPLSVAIFYTCELYYSLAVCQAHSANPNSLLNV